jgi:hypothetical protein
MSRWVPDRRDPEVSRMRLFLIIVAAVLVAWLIIALI